MSLLLLQTGGTDNLLLQSGDGLLLQEATGGTTYTTSPAGSCTASGALRASVSKALAGSSTGTGALAKSCAKPLAGSTTATGALANLTAKPLAGSTAAAGAVAKSVGKGAAGSTTATGAEANAVAKPLAGSTTPSGALARQARKPLAGGVTGSGAVSTLKVALLALAGALTGTGALLRRAAKALAGFVTGSGALTTSGGSEPTTVLPGGTFRRPLWSWPRAFVRRFDTWPRVARRPLPTWLRVWRYTVTKVEPTTLTIMVSDDRDFLFDFSKAPELVAGGTIASAEIKGGSGLTVGSPAVTAAVLDGIPAGKGVAVEISGATAERVYTLACVATLATSGRKLTVPARLVAADY